MTNPNSISYKFITIADKEYKKAVELRTTAFFDGMENTHILIGDKYEKTGMHLVCLKNHKVIGTGRLNVECDYGIISQMAIDKNYQGKGIGTVILKTLIKKCNDLNLNEIKLSARKTAIDFYKNFGFKGVGELYPSIKTGILHQNMEMALDETSEANIDYGKKG